MRAIRLAPLAALLAGVLLLAATPAAATLILPRDLATMVGESTHIVRGKVLSVESHWNAERTLILTEVRLDVSDTFKGRRRPEVTLEIHGGQVGDIVLDVIGSPSFAPDEDVLVFAAAGKDGLLRLPHLGHNKFRVEREADGTLWVSSGDVELESFAPGLAQALDAAGRLPYPVFVHRLHAATGRGGQ
jgi:hypothetical protein